MVALGGSPQMPGLLRVVRGAVGSSGLTAVVRLRIVVTGSSDAAAHDECAGSFGLPRALLLQAGTKLCCPAKLSRWTDQNTRSHTSRHGREGGRSGTNEADSQHKGSEWVRKE